MVHAKIRLQTVFFRKHALLNKYISDAVLYFLADPVLNSIFACLAMAAGTIFKSGSEAMGPNNPSIISHFALDLRGFNVGENHSRQGKTLLAGCATIRTIIFLFLVKGAVFDPLLILCLDCDTPPIHKIRRSTCAKISDDSVRFKRCGERCLLLLLGSLHHCAVSCFALLLRPIRIAIWRLVGPSPLGVTPV